MILSDKPSANIDWKLNKLLTASRASRNYVSRPAPEAADNKPGFSPWAPREINKRSVDIPATDPQQDDAAADGVTTNSAEPRDEAQLTTVATTQKAAASSEDGTLMSAGDLEQLRSAAFEQGKRQARADLGQSVQDNELRFGELLEALSGAKVDLSSLQTSVAELSLFIARQVVRAEITVDSTWHQALIERCLEEIRQHGNDLVTVRLSRADFDRHHLRLMQGHESVVFAPDDRLRDGDVEVDMGATQVSELISAKFALIAQQMLAAVQVDDADQRDADDDPFLMEAD